MDRFIFAFGCIGLLVVGCGDKKQADGPGGQGAMAPALQAIPIKLPKAATGRAVSGTIMAVTIDPQGRLYFNGKRTTRERLGERLRQEARDNPKARVIIGADKSVPHGHVVSVLDLCRLAGVTRYALQIDPAAPKRPPPAPR